MESFTNSGGCVPNFNCRDNKDCNMDQICMKGKCLDSCSSKKKCSKMGQSCLKISPANSDICFEHEDCAKGQICIKGKCQVLCDLSMANSTCPKGQQCQKRKINKPMKIKM